MHVDYDQIAATYNRRYEVSDQPGIAARLQALAGEVQAGRVLEVGCGTGRWLNDLVDVAPHVVGLDYSAGMLRQARQRPARLDLARGTASRLPFPGATFDLVYCVNALHHFDDARAFVAEAHRLLRLGGALAVLAMTPHGRRDWWYIYHYFDGTYERDIARFPTWGTVLDWMLAEGMEDARWQVVELIEEHRIGRDVLDDPFLTKDSTSQLVLLTDEEYTAGLHRIQADLAAAEARGEQLIFKSRVLHAMLVARKRQPGLA